MGPILICDKSTLQGLGRGELNVLRKYYFLNIPPVLLVEILGDLKKHTDASMSRDEVRQLAEKMVPACSAVNVDFRHLIRGELAGHPVAIDCRPVLPGGQHVISKDGKGGVIFQENTEDQALLRWQNGVFHQAEDILAEAWRLSTMSIDLEAMQRDLRSAYSGQLNLRTLADTALFVDGLLASAPPDVLLMWFLRDVGLNPDIEHATLATDCARPTIDLSVHWRRTRHTAFESPCFSTSRSHLGLSEPVQPIELIWNTFTMLRSATRFRPGMCSI